MHNTLRHGRNLRLLGAILSSALLLSVMAPSEVALAAPNSSEQTAEQQPGISATTTEIAFGQPSSISLQASNTPANVSLSAAVSIDGQALTTVPLDAAGAANVAVTAAAYPVGEHTVSVSLVDAATSSTVFASTTTVLKIRLATSSISAFWRNDDHSVKGKATGEFGTIPSGSVTFSYGGNVVGSAALSTDGSYVGSFLPSRTSSDSSLLTVNYAGDSNHASSSTKTPRVIVDYFGCDRREPQTPFADVTRAHKFHTEIAWMSCQRYSMGWQQASSKPLYKPNDSLTRAAMAAFVYRMEAPSDYQAPRESPFSDVAPGDPFYKEITWMWHAGLSKGYTEANGKPSFRPSASLSREAMAAFIYRLEAPKGFVAPTSSPFTDLTPGASFYKEITWLYEAKLTTGNKTANGREYLPKQTLSRAAMAAFVYRLVENYRS